MIEDETCVIPISQKNAKQISKFLTKHNIITSRTSDDKHQNASIGEQIAIARLLVQRRQSMSHVKEKHVH